VPAEQALERAHQEARKAARRFREQKLERVKARMKIITQHLAKGESLFKTRNITAGEEVVSAALKQGQQELRLGENQINSLGYMYLGQGKVDMAIAVFKYNILAYPTSGNVYDSLGEALAKKGELKLAIKNYQKAYQLDPANRNALTIIKQLQDRLAKKKK
jgi:tetratricopeptide (TPR) repeat protein